ALVSALLGRVGGKFADRKGNSYLFYLASIPLTIGFGVLSVMAGIPPAWIWIFLTLASIGQTWMQVAMSNTISQTLSEEQAGIGMGLYTMMFFIASAASTTLIGKVLDFGSMIQFNPFQRYELATSYSNAFF